MKQIFGAKCFNLDSTLSACSFAWFATAKLVAHFDLKIIHSENVIFPFLINFFYEIKRFINKVYINFDDNGDK